MTYVCIYVCMLVCWVLGFGFAVNESFERLASTGLMPNMIFYLMNDYHMAAATGSILLQSFSAICNALALCGAFVADSYLGRFRVIAIGSISSLLVSIVWSPNLCFILVDLVTII